MKHWKKLWKELNRSIFVGERLQQNLRVLTYVSVFTAVLGLGLIILDFAIGETMPIPAFATFFGGTACAYFAGIRKNRAIACIFPTAFCAIMFTIYLFTGFMQGTGIFWSLLMPIGLSYFVGVKYCIYISTYYAVLYAVVFYTPLRERVAMYYPETIMLRFPILFVSLSVFTFIAMVQYHRMALRDMEYTDRLNAEVNRQTAMATERAARLELMSEESVHMLAMAIDAKDRYTNGHSFRVSAYSVALTRHLGWSEEEVHALQREEMLHDIGKIGIPDAVLNKPGHLTEEEFDVVKSHTTVGGSILDRSESMEGAANVARFHHERYAGGGYPTGCSGEAIPLHARVVTIADAYDAMRSDRVYRKGLAPERIREEFVQGSGRQFNPGLLDAFLELMDSGELDAVTAAANRVLSGAVGQNTTDKVPA